MPGTSLRRRRLAGLLAITAAATGLTATPAYGIAGGTPAPAGAYPFVAHVAVGDVRACSGALVAPSWVVTAAPCFADSGAAGAPAQPTTVTVGRSDLAAGASGRVRTVTDLVRHSGGEVVLAKLDAAVTDLAPVPVASTPPAPGEVVRGAGYGRTATEWVPGRLATAEFAVEAVAATTIAVNGSASACMGDAGGPLFREDGGSPRLVAVNATSWQHGCLGSTETRQGGTGTRLDTVADWITRNTADPHAGTVAPPNTGFENGLTGWTQYGSGGATASTQRAYAGTTSARITDPSTTAATGLDGTPMPAAPGVRYTAGAWVNVTDGTPDLYLRFFDAAGGVLQSTFTSFSGDAGQWTQLRLTATAPAGTERVAVLLYSAKAHTGTAYFDQVELVRAAGIPLSNTGFESGLTGWSQYGSGGNTASADRAYEGVTSAKITDTSTTAATGLETGRQPAVPGVGYTTTAWVNTAGGTPGLYLRFYDAAGKVLLSTATSPTGAPGRWTRLGTTATAPAGTDRVTVLLYLPIAGTGTAYFDQVDLRRAADVAVPGHGFENGLAGWTQFGSGGNTASADRAYTGTTSATIVDTSAAAATGLESLRLPAVAGVRYTGVAWMYVQSGTPSIYLRFHDASGALLSSAAQDFTGGANRWAPVQVAATAPAGTASVSVLLYSKQAVTGTAYADHVVIH
jgi:hypothetical protein